jgi:polyvinyl alcohol dehydrogenase (cytochrome)
VTEPLKRRIGAAAAAALLVAWTATGPDAQTTGGTRQDQLSVDTVDGAAVFARACRACHDGAIDSRAPGEAALRARTPQAIIEALLTGPMRLQGSRLSGLERRAIAEYLSGRTGAANAGGAARDAIGHCQTAPPFSADDGPARWTGWSPSVENTRFQAATAAGLTVEQVPRLKLKWAFGFPDANTAWSQPSVAGGRLFVGSQNGTVYALDTRTGCTHWTFAARGSIRTAAIVGRPALGRPPAVFVGTLNGYVHAIDAESGRPLWERQVETHPYGRLTGSPTLYDGRLYVPVSSLEEAQGSIPEYECCTFRGSLAALDAATGRVIWQTFTVPEPKRRGTSAAGVPLWGPSGNAIWAAPTIDAKRGVVYAATGNTYSGPSQPLSDAVIAFDLATGAIKWTRQMTVDVFVSRCPPAGNPNCPDALGPDFDFGNSPILASLPGGADAIVIGQKSGIGWALDPDHEGAVLWQYRAGRGGTLGGIEWGSAVDANYAYFPVSDIQHPDPGGLHAVRLATGERVWHTPAPPPKCGTGRGCNGAQSAAITVISGMVFSGSNDGAVRAFSTKDGSIVWEYDTNRAFATVNGVSANGASMIGPGPVIAGGMMFVNSGYGQYGGRPGNVLLAFGID